MSAIFPPLLFLSFILFAGQIVSLWESHLCMFNRHRICERRWLHIHHKTFECAPAIETPLSIGCVELAGLDMLSNEMLRAFSVTHFNEAVFPLGELMNWEASVMDGMNWSIEDGRMRLCDILVLGNYPVKWMNKSAGISSAPSSTEKPPVSKCFARLYPQESSWDNEELVTFRLSLLSLAFCAPASLCRYAGVVFKLQNYNSFFTVKIATVAIFYD